MYAVFFSQPFYIWNPISYFVDVFFPQAKIQLISLSRLVLLIYVLTRHAISEAYLPRSPPSVAWNVRPPTGATTLALFLLSRDLALN